MSEYLTLAQARESLGVSAYIFNERYRPQLTEISRGPRTALFPAVEVERLKSQSDGMFKRKTVSDALDHAWDTLWQDARGAFKKESLKRQVANEIGHLKLDKLSADDLDDWVQRLKDDDKSAATIKSRLSCLSKALTMASRKGWISEIPLFPEVSISNRKIRYLLDEPDEEALLIDACGCLRYQDCDVLRLAIVFLVDTGCRVSELLKLRWRHIRNHRAIFESRKADDHHSVRLTQRAEEAIEALLDNSHWIHRTRGCDKSPTRCRTAQNWLTHSFTKVRDHAKLKDISLHTLRHTCASRLVQGGADLYDVKAILGHSSISVTERYAHLAPSTADRSIAILENRSLPNKVSKMRR